MTFEASGSDPWGTPPHAPIQLGIYVPKNNLKIEYLIGGWDWNEYEWTPNIEDIHGITQEDLKKAEPAWKVDIRIASQLLDVVGQKMWNLICGYNVAGYDRQFIVRHFPLLNRLLSYRTIDLNSIIFSMTQDEKGYNDTKRRAKQYAEAMMKEQGHSVTHHTALSDAILAVYCYEYLTATV